MNGTAVKYQFRSSGVRLKFNDLKNDLSNHSLNGFQKLFDGADQSVAFFYTTVQMDNG